MQILRSHPYSTAVHTVHVRPWLRVCGLCRREEKVENLERTAVGVAREDDRATLPHVRLQSGVPAHVRIEPQRTAALASSSLRLHTAVAAVPRLRLYDLVRIRLSSPIDRRACVPVRWRGCTGCRGGGPYILSLTTLSAAAGLSGTSSAAKPYEPSSSSPSTRT